MVKSTSNNNYIQYKSNGDKDKILTITEYLNMIRPYLLVMINDYKNKGEWIIQISAENSFFFF